MKIDVNIPQVGESITEVTIGQWVKGDGDMVELDEVICEIESEKATLELRSESQGQLKILVPAGEIVGIGVKIGEIDTDVKIKAGEESITGDGSTEKTVVAPPAEVAEKERPSADHPSRVSPVAAKLLEEAGISLSEVRGTGTLGRISKADAERAIKTLKETKEIPTLSAKETGKPEIEEQIPETVGQVLVQMPGKRGERREKITTLRKTIAKRLVAAKNETAMLTTFNEINMTILLEVRNRYKEPFQKKYGIKLGFMSFFVKASCIALKEFPEVNAMIDGDEFVYHDYCDISIAVSTPRGLVVPVIFNAESMNIPQIEAEVARLADKGRENKLTIEEMTGGTFSITNGGVFGSMLSTPIINAPQTAILGIHKIEERPIALNGEVVIRPMMYVALSYDHRIIDGKESVNFLVRVKELIEEPARILLDV